MYLFDAQNRWGYERGAFKGYLHKKLYLFDAQNRWGYEQINAAFNDLRRMYLFDAQNRWGYEAGNLKGGLLWKLVSIRCSESLGL